MGLLEALTASEQGVNMGTVVDMGNRGLNQGSLLMTKTVNNPRREEVSRLRVAGLTYAEIGRRLGLT